MTGGGIEWYVEKVDNANNSQVEQEEVRNGNPVEKVDANGSQVKQEEVRNGNSVEVAKSNTDQGVNLPPKQAEQQANWVVENAEAIDDVQMLNEIIKAFNEDDWRLTNLRHEYNAITTKIMASYNEEIQRIKDKNKGNKEDMENKNNTEFSSLSSESEERTWDFTEQINNINKNQELAQYLSNEIMKPQPKELLGQISDINEVLEKWSEENKKILNETISQVQTAIARLYHEAWLDKNNA